MVEQNTNNELFQPLLRSQDIARLLNISVPHAYKLMK